MYPRAHFNGAAKDDMCAYGVYINIMEDQHFSIYCNGGSGTNNKDGAMGLYDLLTFFSFLNTGPLWIYGDSKIIIDHVIRKHSIKNANLFGWMHRIS